MRLQEKYDVNKDINTDSRLFQKTWREMRRRLKGPQRHRLLQGYPQPQFMSQATPNFVAPVQIDTNRKLILGVLPHSFCNPKVQGCGFCTFPHESFEKSAAAATVEAVAHEISQRTQALGTQDRQVSALYFGGGTANLITPQQFELLLTALDDNYSLEQAEFSFEGVPIYFLTRKQALLDILEKAPVRHRRLSLGVQTFDMERLKTMGRDAFGTVTEIQQLVDSAHQRGMTISCDLLVNLPHQSLPEMLKDIQTAIDMGFDQVCIYHLVLFRNIGTPWSTDSNMLQGLPDNEQALKNWQVIVETMAEAGFQQQTLTNFERKPLANTEKRFVYEELSFRPTETDAIGFGPSGITTLSNKLQAYKTINHESATSYRESMQAHGQALNKTFQYHESDMKLLHMTRSLARLKIDRALYQTVFGTDILNDFGNEFEAARQFGLVDIADSEIRLTTQGNFYADTVAGTLAWPRVQEMRQQGLGPVGPRQLPITEAGKINMG